MNLLFVGTLRHMKVESRFHMDSNCVRHSDVSLPSRNVGQNSDKLPVPAAPEVALALRGRIPE